MGAAVWPHRKVFVTPMAAVAGAVADHVLEAMVAGRRLERAYVNNGGDIALHLSEGQRFRSGVVQRLEAPSLDGIAEKRHPGKRLDINMYEEGGRLRGIKRLPLNLLDALRLMEKSTVLRDAFGKEVVRSYLKLRMQEWNDFMSHPSAWERENTLDC